MDSMQDKEFDSAGPSRKVTSLTVPQRDYCDFCPFGASPNLPYKGHDLKYEALEKSAKSGRCQACVGIVKFLEAHSLKPTRLDFIPLTHGGLDTTFTFADGTSHGPYQFFTADNGSAGNLCLNYSGATPMEIPRMRAPSGNTSSTEAFDTLKHWMSRCQAEHPLCQPVAEKMLPHRVLEIESIQPLRVRVAENCPKRESYACLSHRWAPETSLNCLKTHNRDLYKERVPEDRFYPLVRDAIAATFRLGLCFIWIDCYCIIQDNEEDWKKEAATMGSIYENAFFTISATCSESGCSIFSAITPTCKAYQVTEIEGEPVYIRKEIQHPCFLDIFVKRPELLSGPSLERAWIFQERLLSNRFIHFTVDELFWECRESTWCECKSPAREWETRRKVTKRTLGAENWGNIADRYNETQLTFEKDRLPALAGLARRYQELHGKETYLAGLWEDDLPAALAWQKVAGHEPRPLDQFAPTWSWTSMPRGKGLFCNDTKRSGRLVGYSMKPPVDDVYTSAESIGITVEAPVLDLKVYKHKDHLIGRLEDYFLRIRADFKTDPDDHTKYRTVPDGSECLLLFLHQDTEYLNWDYTFGIVLQQQDRGTDGKAARFERIGSFTNLDHEDCYLDESDDYAEYCGGSFPPFAVYPPDWDSPPFEWFMDRAETRQVTLV